MNLCEKVKLNVTLMQMNPTNKIHKDSLLLTDNLLYLKSEYPNNKLKLPQRTLIKGDEFPKPGGFANGDGNELPEIPLTKCGTVLARNAPEKNAARY